VPPACRWVPFASSPPSACSSPVSNSFVTSRLQRRYLTSQLDRATLSTGSSPQVNFQRFSGTTRVHRLLRHYRHCCDVGPSPSRVRDAPDNGHSCPIELMSTRPKQSRAGAGKEFAGPLERRDRGQLSSYPGASFSSSRSRFASMKSAVSNPSVTRS
jgi:hypothetical protein